MGSTAPPVSGCRSFSFPTQATAACASASSISRAKLSSSSRRSISGVYPTRTFFSRLSFLRFLSLCVFPSFLRILSGLRFSTCEGRVSASVLKTSVNPKSPQFEKSARQMTDLLTTIKNEEETIREGGGAKAIEAQHKKNRSTARERIAALIDPGTRLFELGIYAAHERCEEWGGAPAAGTITGLGRVAGRMFMIIANDATVKAGAFFPMTAKKVIRAQNIATDNRIPTIYLVDSAGVFLPLQEDVFPDTDDFGRVFRNNAVMSALGIPQITAI